MSDPFSDRYWIEEFQVTQADLDRIAAHIRETQEAHDLTALAQRVVRGRLAYGPDASAPAPIAWTKDPSVRIWDPAGEWKEGDHVIGTHVLRKDVYEVVVGEVTAVEPPKVRIRLDRVGGLVVYQQAAPGSENARNWHNHIRKVIAEKSKSPRLDEQAEAIRLKHGERIDGQLLEALRTDERFVRLAGRWFLHELAAPVSEEQLAALAWAMVPLEESRSTADLVPLVQPPLAEGDPGLFGLYLAMRQRSDLFTNADPGKRPRWVLAGPPPGTFTPQHPAYDPETYEVLCLPGEPASSQVVQRLWELKLLQAVV